MWSNIASASTSLKQPSEVEREDQVVDSRWQNGDSSGNNKLGGTSTSKGSPLMRYKHAVCSAPSGYIYIHGGRFGNLPLDDDVWRFDPHQNSWLQLETSGQKPPSLQEHTLVEYNEQLYLFGGQVSASNNENSFWQLDLVSNEWRSLSMKSSRFGAHLGPTNRRGHSAMIYGDSMYIFGGFEDFRGSSAQLWEFDLFQQRWELRNLSSTSACHPEPRHSHSAVVFEDSMFVYGGLSNLKPLNDLWRWSWPERRWFRERTRGKSPGQLHGHTAVQAFGSMFVFGGERNGRTTRSLWRLNLSNLTWQKIRPKGPRPSPTTWHGAIANPLSILDEANYIIEAGNPELLKNSSLSDTCFSQYTTSAGAAAATIEPTAISNGNQAPTQSMQILSQQQSAKTRPKQQQQHHIEQKVPLTHSQSVINAEVTAAPKQRHLSNAKRKSRLSFLRGRRKQLDPPARAPVSRSSYELKHMQNSASATNFATNNRHSISAAIPQPAGPSNTVKQPSTATTAIKSEANDNNDDDESNVKILDDLDTDIKEMFQRALSPSDHTANGCAVGGGDDDDDEQMSLDVGPISSNGGLDQSSAPLTSSTSRLQYQTARDRTLVGDCDLNMRSQRTSYAPSELNTLATTRDESQQQQQLPADGSGGSRLAPYALLAAPRTSGYHGRNNRPKSEIVQSLIDRADARIKHLYTPFFNHTNDQQHQHGRQAIFNRPAQGGGGDGSSGGNKESHHATSSSGHQQQHGGRFSRHSLEKSKRHTIHQTMTYYNLYFSEDSKSNHTSPPSDDSSNNNNNSNQANEDGRLDQMDTTDLKVEPLATAATDASSNQLVNHHHHHLSRGMVRDDLSSSTIKGSGALVGVHGSQLDRESQLSFEGANTSSTDSKTLCGDLNFTPDQVTAASTLTATTSATAATGGYNQQQLSSLTNALTARRETGAESSCDNTSLSFSIIAEFEEDDMLQYSSPTKPDINSHQLMHSNQQFGSIRDATSVDEYADSRRQQHYGMHEEDDVTMASVQMQQNHADAEATRRRALTTIEDGGWPDLAAGGVGSMATVAQRSSEAAGEHQQQQHRQDGAGGGHERLGAHKSASSGYDSISGYEHHHSSASGQRTEQRGRGHELHDGGSSSAMNHHHGGHIRAGASASDTQEDSSVRTESSLGGYTEAATTETSPEQSAMRCKKLKGRSELAEEVHRRQSSAKGPLTNTSSLATATSMALTTTTTTTTSGDDQSSLVDSSLPTGAKSLPSSPPDSAVAKGRCQAAVAAAAQMAASSSQLKMPLMFRSRQFFRGSKSRKNRYWQLCMFVIGGKQGGAHGLNEPITIWRLYI